MARMHPLHLGPAGRLGRIDPREPSDAERMVFEEIKRQFDDRWDCYYSVWFRDTAPGEHAEADFALVSAAGVFLFEVKGGRLERLQDGQWQFRTTAGRVVDTRLRGPFDQVRDAWYAMYDHVQLTCGSSLSDDCVWGYGVITPQCQLRFAGPDPGGPRDLWLDSSRFPEQFKEYLDEVIEYWTADSERKGRNRSHLRVLSMGDRATLEKALRPAVRCVSGAGVEAREIGREMVRLTREQCRALDYAQLEPRLVVQGGAGTGKTLVALEKAARECEKRQRIIFLCYNRLLADHLAREARLKGAVAETFHQLVYSLLRAAGMQDNVPADWDELNRIAPELVLNALDRLGDRFIPWDFLALDEAQDLMTEEFISVLDLILKGGIKGGRWLLCLDTEQAIFSEQYDARYFDEFFINTGARRIVLPDNCRNTRQIAAYGHGVGGIAEQSRAQVEGRVPVFDYFSDMQDLRRKFRRIMSRLIAEFRDAKLDESCITVLLGRREPFEEIVLQELSSSLVSGQLLRPGEAPVAAKVQVVTIQAFKGLESDAVVVLGLDDLSQDWQKKLFYVASTRARAILEVLLPESQQSVIAEASPGVWAGLVAHNLAGSTP